MAGKKGRPNIPIPTSKHQKKQPEIRITPPLSLKKAVPLVLSPKTVLAGEAGFGKTTVAANAPSPIIFMCGDTGYQTLLDANLVPECVAVEVEDYRDLLFWLGELAKDPQEIKTIAIDCLKGAEWLCWKLVCERDYDGEFGFGNKKGFSAFGNGPDVAVKDWMLLLAALERCNKGGMNILILSHTHWKRKKNPFGDDYDKIMPNVHQKTWDETKAWADCVLYGAFTDTVTDGTDNLEITARRCVYAEGRQNYEAKNRTGAPEYFYLDDQTTSWDVMWKALVGELGETT